MWFCELFVEGDDGISPDSWWFSWPETEGGGEVGWWYLTLFAAQFHFHTNSLALSLSPFFPQTLSLTHQFSPSNTERRSPCCLIACSPSRFSDIVVVCLYCSVCVTCICPDSLEGVCFCSQCCKQGGAPFPNHSVGDGYFHRSYFLVYHFRQ